MKYRIELSEKQLKVVMKALERYFRLNMGQFFDYTDEIAFVGFEYNKDNPDNGRLFDERISRRDDARAMFDSAFETMCPKLTEKSEDTERAIDMFREIRYRLWDWKEEPKSHGTVDSYAPTPFLSEELPKIERIT